MTFKLINTEKDIKKALDEHWQKDGGIESVHFIMNDNWRNPDATFDLVIRDNDGASLYKCSWGLHQTAYDELALTKAKLFDYRNGRWLQLS